jgi:hypothetical protein
MKLANLRIVLGLNTAALFAAYIVAVQTVYVVEGILGPSVHMLGWVWYVFIPPLIMFVVNNAGFSWFFLFAHVALITTLSFECWAIYVGAPLHYTKGLTNAQLLLFIASLACFAIYLIVKGIQSILPGEER